MNIDPNSTFLMIGDSITDAGRSEGGEDTPWMPGKGLGSGYVSLVHAHIQAASPEKSIRVINRGCSGNKVTDLRDRWQADVLDYKPDYLSVMIGINDVWRQCDIPLQTDAHVQIEEYEAVYTQILEQVRPSLKGLLLAAPYIIEDNTSDGMRQLIDQYAAVVKKLAAKFDADYVDVQTAFDAHLKHRHSSSLAWDRIHPNTTGHLIIAQSVLAKLTY